MFTAGLALGIAIGMQTRTSLAIRSRLNIPPPQLVELAYRLRQQERVREALEAQIHELRNQISAYEQAAATQQPHLEALGDQVQRLKTLNGLTALEGPGVVVDLDDSQRSLRPGENPNEVILHNYDVVAVVNDLWVAGAEAIAVNGERLVGTTGIQSVFATMMVNENRIVPPIRIAAIGEPNRLAPYLSRRGGYLDLLQAFAFPVRVARAKRISMPAYGGTFTFRSAQPTRSE